MPVLIVANTSDACPASPPGDAERIAAALSRAPSKEVVYLHSIVSGGQPCEAMSPHDYGAIEAEAVERITEWIVTTTTSQ